MAIIGIKMSYQLKPRVEMTQFQFRMTEENKKLLKYASEILGISLSAFILNTATREANFITMQHEHCQKAVMDKENICKGCGDYHSTFDGKAIQCTPD